MDVLSDVASGVGHALTWLVVDWNAFVNGLLGGIAGEAWRWTRILLLIRRPVGHFRFAVLLSVLLAVVGGLYASRVLGAPSGTAAFVAGLTLPLTVSGFLGNPPPESRRRPDDP